LKHLIKPQIEWYIYPQSKVAPNKQSARHITVSKQANVSTLLRYATTDEQYTFHTIKNNMFRFPLELLSTEIADHRRLLTVANSALSNLMDNSKSNRKT